MSKPRICEVLGVEPDERFEIVGYQGQFYANEKGVYFLRDDYDAPMWITSTTLINAINNPLKIIHHSRWTDQDVEFVKTLNHLYPDVHKVERSDGGNCVTVYNNDGYPIMRMYANPFCFPNLKAGESAELDAIIGGEK